MTNNSLKSIVNDFFHVCVCFKQESQKWSLTYTVYKCLINYWGRKNVKNCSSGSQNHKTSHIRDLKSLNQPTKHYLNLFHNKGVNALPFQVVGFPGQLWGLQHSAYGRSKPASLKLPHPGGPPTITQSKLTLLLIDSTLNMLRCPYCHTHLQFIWTHSYSCTSLWIRNLMLTLTPHVKSSAHAKAVTAEQMSRSERVCFNPAFEGFPKLPALPSHFHFAFLSLIQRAQV
jgi:hypothetical protein